MKYVELNKDNIVMAIHPEVDERFPTVPIEKRFSAEFLSKCVKVANNTKVTVGQKYEDGEFSDVPRQETPAELPSELVEPSELEKLKSDLAAKDAQIEELQVAVAELAEIVAGGAV